MNLLRGWLTPRVGPNGLAPMVRPSMDAPMRDRQLWRMAEGLDLPPEIIRAVDGIAPTHWTPIKPYFNLLPGYVSPTEVPA